MCKKKKKKEKPILDTETTIADMNVEGFRWYDPQKKQGQQPIGPVTKKEYWAMVKGAFLAVLPMIGCLIAGGLLVFFLARMWLG